MDSPLIRLASVADAAIIVHHRIEMLRDMGQPLSSTLAEDLRVASMAALTDALSQGTYVGWLAMEDSTHVLAGVGVHLKPQLPRLSPDMTKVVTTPVPLVVNVYTEPYCRRRGIARALMRTLMEWAQAQGMDRVLLHASDAGRPLYTSLGFVPTNEMRWVVMDIP